MVLSKYVFDKKCDFDLCQNKAVYALRVGAKGDLIMCESCFDKLKSIFRKSKGEQNEKK